MSDKRLVRLAALLLGCGLVTFSAPALADDEPPAARQDLAQTLDEARKTPTDREVRAVGSLQLDHAFLRMYDQALQTTGARLGIGAQGAHVTSLVMADFGVGSLGTSGLRATSGSLGVELLYRALPFLRLGGGPRLGYLNVSRVTSGSAMEAFSIGAFLSVNVDLYDFGPRDDHGLYMGGRIDLDMYQGNGEQAALVWGPELVLGFRL